MELLCCKSLLIECKTTSNNSTFKILIWSPHSQEFMTCHGFTGFQNWFKLEPQEGMSKVCYLVLLRKTEKSRGEQGCVVCVCVCVWFVMTRLLSKYCVETCKLKAMCEVKFKKSEIVWFTLVLFEISQKHAWSGNFVSHTFWILQVKQVKSPFISSRTHQFIDGLKVAWWYLNGN